MFAVNPKNLRNSPCSKYASIYIFFSNWRMRKLFSYIPGLVRRNISSTLKPLETERRASIMQVSSSIPQHISLLFSFLLFLGSSILSIWIFSLSHRQFFLQRQKNGHLGVYFLLFSFFRFQLTNLITLETQRCWNLIPTSDEQLISQYVKNAWQYSQVMRI